MISRPLLWFIALTLLAIVATAWWAGRYPARVTIINSAGRDIENLTVESGSERVTVALLLNGSARSMKVSPGAPVTIRCCGTAWTSADRLRPAQAMVVYAMPGGRFDERSRVGRLAR